MFSDHLRKIDNASGKTLLLVAAGLAIVCQLVAMVIVAQGQVDKAYMREASQAIERTAIAGCVETSYGAKLKSCANRLTTVAEPVSTDASNSKPNGSLAMVSANRN